MSLRQSPGQCGRSLECDGAPVSMITLVVLVALGVLVTYPRCRSFVCDGSRSVPSPPTLRGTQGSPHLGSSGWKAHFLSCAACCGSWWCVPLARPLNYTWLLCCSRSLLFQGFFCKTEDDFDDWCQQVRQVGGGSPHVGWAGGRLSRGLQFGVPPPSAPGAGLAVWLVASTSLCVENVGTDLAREPWAGGLRFVSAVATRGGSKWSLPPGLWFAALHGSDRRGLMMADSAEGQESLSSETASPSSSTVSPAGSADLWAGARGCTPMAVSNSSVC